MGRRSRRCRGLPAGLFLDAWGARQRWRGPQTYQGVIRSRSAVQASWSNSPTHGRLARDGAVGGTFGRQDIIRSAIWPRQFRIHRPADESRASACSGDQTDVKI
eukprot:16306-Pelagococcus_subviridis.AAC.1